MRENVTFKKSEIKPDSLCLDLTKSCFFLTASFCPG